MEKAILRTLAYADIFDYPLTIREIHKWLIGKKSNLRQIEKTLEDLNQESRIKNQGEYYYLSERQQIVAKRKRKEKYSYVYIRKVRLVVQILKLVPWVKLVGVSGGLAMNNAGKVDDIDLFIITAKDRLWISRLFILALLSLTGQRRKPDHKKLEVSGKICPNTILAEDQLIQKKNLYLAHEVLQMKVLWQRGGAYAKFLSDNEWAFKFLPNWIVARSSATASLRGVKRRSNLLPVLRLPRSLRSLAMTMDKLENLAKKFQLKLMVKPKGAERILPGAVYFHPVDYMEKVLQEYKQRIDKIN